LRSERTREMPNMVPNDVKPSKIKSIAATNIDAVRNLFRYARGYLLYHNVDHEEQKGVYCVFVFWRAHYRSGGTPKLRRLEMKSVEDILYFTRLRER
jgi:hypothetical protein